MKKTERILACVDFSDYSLMTLEQAVTLSRALGAEILILNVIHNRDKWALEKAVTLYPQKKKLETIMKEMVESRYQALREMVRDSFPKDKSSITLRVDVGSPSEVILQTAEAEGADLIVIANKGRGNLSRVFFGSVAEKVLRHSKVTVVSVRDRNTFRRNA